MRRTGEWKDYLARRRLDPAFKVRKTVSRAIRMHVGKGTRSKRTEELSGCSMKFLVSHIESTFCRGMAWENYGTGWHIDHIIPLSRWNLKDTRQSRLAFNWTNLQALSAKANLEKRDKLTLPQMSLLLEANE
tara:strand:- start:95 stop:490 length:396 start_codon:yes stop_codon:yes gene_type:complete